MSLQFLRNMEVKPLRDVLDKMWEHNRQGLNERNKARLLNENPTVIANNCNGGVISHDLDQRFCSPTINLMIDADNYLKFLSSLKHYLSLDESALIELDTPDIEYPMGLLEDITIHFVHYPSFEAAKSKWFERAARVDYDNMYVIWTMRDGCTLEHLEAFSQMDFQHKAFLAHIPVTEYDFVHVFPHWNSHGECRIAGGHVLSLSGKRYLDEWDYVSFLNEGHEQPSVEDDTGK